MGWRGGYLSEGGKDGSRVSAANAWQDGRVVGACSGAVEENAGVVERFGALGGRVGLEGLGCTRLRYQAMDERVTTPCIAPIVHRCASSGLTEQSNLGRVPAKASNVVANPFHC